MNYERKFLSILFLYGFLIPSVNGQETIPASGGNASGSGGTVSYTVGQIVYGTFSGSNGTVLQGVQQPYEISVVTSIESAKDINLECNVYPNPTKGKVKLVVKTKNFENLRFLLFDLNGTLIQDKKVDTDETEILMDRLSPSTYLLKILSGNTELKTFKIIKN